MRDLSHSIIGTWDLTRRCVRLSNGDPLPGGDTTPSGRIVYTAEGQVIAIVLPTTSSHDGDSSEFAAVAAAVNGLTSYFGSYTVDDATGRVHHRVTGAAELALVGRTLVRDAEILDDRLTLRSSFVAGGVDASAELVWCRSSESNARGSGTR